MAAPFSVAKGLPAREAFSITPDDSNDLARSTNGLYVGVAGDVKVELVGDQGAAVTFVALAAGVVHPLAVRKVHSTGTTATSIVGVI